MNSPSSVLNRFISQIPESTSSAHRWLAVLLLHDHVFIHSLADFHPSGMVSAFRALSSFDSSFQFDDVGLESCFFFIELSVKESVPPLVGLPSS